MSSDSYNARLELPPEPLEFYSWATFTRLPTVAILYLTGCAPGLGINFLERDVGLEPTYLVWKTRALPLDESRWYEKILPQKEPSVVSGGWRLVMQCVRVSCLGGIVWITRNRRCRASPPHFYIDSIPDVMQGKRVWIAQNDENTQISGVLNLKRNLGTFIQSLPQTGFPGFDNIPCWVTSNPAKPRCAGRTKPAWDGVNGDGILGRLTSLHGPYAPWCLTGQSEDGWIPVDESARHQNRRCVCRELLI